MSAVTPETYNPFAGDGKRAQILRAMRQLSDDVKVEYRPWGRSRIKFKDSGPSYGWNTWAEYRYDQVDAWSLLSLARSFGHDTNDIADFILCKYGISEPTA